MSLQSFSLHLLSALGFLLVFSGAWVGAIRPKNIGPQGRIAFGFQDEKGHPAIAALRVSPKSTEHSHQSYFDICTATFISKRYLLTSASCPAWTKYDKNKLAILQSRGNGTFETIAAEILDWFVEPEFWENERETWHSDLALIRVREISDENTFEVATLASPYSDPVSDPETRDKPFTIAGYGLQKFDQSIVPEKLVDAFVTVENCPKQESDLLWDSKKHFCFSGAGDGDDTPICPGDQGAPIFMQRADAQGKWSTILIGVTRGPSGKCGEGTGKENRESMATRVSGHLRWIQYTVCRHDQGEQALLPLYEYDCRQAKIDAGFEQPIAASGSLPNFDQKTSVGDKSSAPLPAPSLNSTEGSVPPNPAAAPVPSAEPGPNPPPLAQGSDLKPPDASNVASDLTSSTEPQPVGTTGN